MVAGAPLVGKLGETMP